MGRPLGVAILSLIAFLIGLVEVLRAFLTFSSPLLAFQSGLLKLPSDAIAFPVYLVLGMIWLFVAYSFWKGAEIGWVLGMIMAVVIAVLNYPIGTVLGALVILYLLVPRGVRNWFTKTGVRKWMGV